MTQHTDSISHPAIPVPAVDTPAMATPAGDIPAVESAEIESITLDSFDNSAVSYLDSVRTAAAALAKPKTEWKPAPVVAWTDSMVGAPRPALHTSAHLDIEQALLAPRITVTLASDTITAPVCAADTVVTIEGAELPAWTQGMVGEHRTVGIGDNSGVLAIVTSIFIMMMLGYKHCRRLFVTLSQNLWGMRHRPNVFDPNTSNETRYLALMAIQWSIYTGLLLYSCISLAGSSQHITQLLGEPIALDPENAFDDTSKLMLLTAVYYVVQLGIYWVLGYTFTTKVGRRQLVQGFVATQSFLGFFLIVPTLVAIFYPAAAYVAIIVGVSLYGVSRILFISKGLRIFYTNFGSLLYFILYLCTLEIIPLILVCQIALFLVDSL